MDSHQGDQRLFHALLKEHKAKNSAVDALFVNETLTSDPSTIREGWATYYEDLAKPADNPEWDPETLQEATSIVQREAEACLSMPRTTIITI